MNTKYKVNIPYFIYGTLNNDMEAFQIYKADKSLNKNYFINKLVYNYYSTINKDIDDFEESIISILKSNNISDIKINKIKDELINANIKIENETKKEYELTFISTSKYESAFLDIEENYLQIYNMSQYLRKLFLSYSRLNQDERERIIFKNEIELIENAISNNKKIVIENFNKEKFKTNPLGIYSSKDRQFVYLIHTPNNSKSNIYPLNICKIKNVTILKEFQEPLKEKVIYKLKTLKNFDLDPQFILRDILDIDVEFTKEGIKKYNKIFINRPNPYKVNDNIMSFKATKAQLFIYFSRFGKEITILNNDELNLELYEYYLDGYLNLETKYPFLKNKLSS